MRRLISYHVTFFEISGMVECWYYVGNAGGSALTVVCGNNKLKSAGSGGLFIFFELIFLGFINTILIQNTLNDLAKVMDKNFIYGDMIHTDYSASTGVADSQDTF